MEQRIIGAFGRYKELWQSLGVTTPLLVGLTLSGVKGWKVLQEPYGFHDLDGAFDRDFVSVPETELSDLTTPVDIALRPLFDFIWNGGGWPGSPNYREGRWVKPS